jgi:cytochrome oxidase assembly protein ShyY1
VTALRWDLEWRLTLFTALLLPALLFLGFWQLDRAEEKIALAAQEAKRLATAPVPLLSLRRADPASLPFTTVEVSGYFHPEALLMKDNQLRAGRYGVDVIGLFYVPALAQWVMLNRGWVAADPGRQSLPGIAIPDADATLTARLYLPPGKPYVLEADRFEALEFPLLVQDLTASALRDALEERLAAPVYPHELRLLPDQPWGFRRDWPIMNSSPAKHRGYALQWFTMAAALLVLFVLRSSNLADVLRRRTG